MESIIVCAGRPVLRKIHRWFIYTGWVVRQAAFILRVSPHPGTQVIPLYSSICRGAGFSDKPEIADYGSDSQSALLLKWLTNSGLTGVTLFGHSAGAFIALTLAQQLSTPAEQIKLCTPGLNSFGASLLEEITSMTEEVLTLYGFSALVAQPKSEGGNDVWLGPFRVCSPQAIWQWASSALADNSSDWIGALAALSIKKRWILLDTASSDEIAQNQNPGCRVGLTCSPLINTPRC